MTLSEQGVVHIASCEISRHAPTYVIAEIGINHNGSVELAKEIIQAAVEAGCDAVKFQKRNPELCVHPEQRGVQRETPWGLMSYIDYRHRIEFGEDQFNEINDYCKQHGLVWFMSAWDEDSLDFCLKFERPAIKIPSALLTNINLVNRAFKTGIPMILSTGMSTQEEVDTAVIGRPLSQTIVCHCISTYPAEDNELNLRVIEDYRARYPYVIGYSGHETGIATTLAAVVFGAKVIERHITTNRAMWGTDQAASLEPQGIRRLVRDIRAIETGMGDGVKRLLASEIPVRRKLRGA